MILALKSVKGKSSEEDEDIAYITRRFQKIVRGNKGFLRKENTSKLLREND